MDEDATWYGSNLRGGHIVLGGFPALCEMGIAPPPLLGPCLLRPRSPISATAELLLIHCTSQICFLLAMYFVSSTAFCAFYFVFYTLQHLSVHIRSKNPTIDICGMRLYFCKTTKAVKELLTYRCVNILKYRCFGTCRTNRASRIRWKSWTDG